MAAGGRPLQRDAYDVTVADQGELHWFTHFAGQRIVNTTRAEGPGVGAVDQEDLVADTNAALPGRKISGDFANIEPLVGSLREHGADRAAPRTASDEAEHGKGSQPAAPARGHDR